MDSTTPLLELDICACFGERILKHSFGHHLPSTALHASDVLQDNRLSSLLDRTAAFARQLARTKDTCKARQGGKAWCRHRTLGSLHARLSAMRALHHAAYRNASLATKFSGCSHWLHNAARDSCQNSHRNKAASGSVKFFWSMWAMTWQRLIVSHSYGTISSYQSLDFKVLGPTMTIGPVV